MTLRSASDAMALTRLDDVHPLPLPAAVYPSRPEGTLIDLLHRGHDGMIHYSRKVAGEWQELGGEPASKRCGLFADDAKAEAVKVDAYFGLHGMWGGAPRRKMANLLPGLQPTERGGKHVRWLTCFHVDLDAYRCGLDSHGAVAAVNRLVDAGKIPSPSLYTLSNGAWAIWRLHDRIHADQPLRAHPDHILRRWIALQGILHTICSEIGSDRNALDVARVTRIPGSVSSKNGKRVGYMIPASIDGKLFSYTLDDMECLLAPYRAKRMPTTDVSAGMPDEKRSLLGKRGYVSRYRLLLDRLDKLRQLRGGWQEGTRDSAIKFVCIAASHLGMSGDEQTKLVSLHMSGMSQPGGRAFTKNEATKRMMWVGKKRASLRDSGVPIGNLRNQTVADSLMVTPDEAAFLSTNCRLPFPAASNHLPLPVLSKREATQRRRDAVLAVCSRLADTGCHPTGTYVRAMLAADGLDAALKTVLRDMAAVGFPSSKTHGEKKTLSHQRTLFPNP